ncbi:hypothetical protein D3C80_1676680 [compost metagenome]
MIRFWLETPLIASSLKSLTASISSSRPKIRLYETMLVLKAKSAKKCSNLLANCTFTSSNLAPDVRVIRAETFIFTSFAGLTVTCAPTGRRSSTASFTAFIISLLGSLLSSDKMDSLTVPPPFQTGNTFTSPTPRTSNAHCR